MLSSPFIEKPHQWANKRIQIYFPLFCSKTSLAIQSGNRGYSTQNNSIITHLKSWAMCCYSDDSWSLLLVEKTSLKVGEVHFATRRILTQKTHLSPGQVFSCDLNQRQLNVSHSAIRLPYLWGVKVVFCRGGTDTERLHSHSSQVVLWLNIRKIA